MLTIIHKDYHNYCSSVITDVLCYTRYQVCYTRYQGTKRSTLRALKEEEPITAAASIPCSYIQTSINSVSYMSMHFLTNLAPRTRSTVFSHVHYFHWGKNRCRMTTWSGYSMSHARVDEHTTTLLRASIAETPFEMTTQSTHLKKHLEYDTRYHIELLEEVTAAGEDLHTAALSVTSLKNYISLRNPGMSPR